MKFLLGLFLFFGIVVYMLSLFQSDSLVQIYCRNEAQKLTPKYVDGGIKFRDKDLEQDRYEVCVEENDNEYVLQMLIKYAQLPVLSPDGQYQ